MRGLPDFNPMDRKWWPDKPDVDFSPSRNKAIIEGTIKQYEADRAKKMAEFKEGLAERTDATTSYLTGRYGIHRSTPVERYFGKRYLAYLRGQDIIGELKMRMTQPSGLRRKVWQGKGVHLGGKKQK